MLVKIATQIALEQDFEKTGGLLGTIADKAKGLLSGFAGGNHAAQFAAKMAPALNATKTHVGEQVLLNAAAKNFKSGVGASVAGVTLPDSMVPGLKNHLSPLEFKGITQGRAAAGKQIGNVAKSISNDVKGIQLDHATGQVANSFNKLDARAGVDRMFNNLKSKISPAAPVAKTFRQAA